MSSAQERDTTQYGNQCEQQRERARVIPSPGLVCELRSEVASWFDGFAVEMSHPSVRDGEFPGVFDGPIDGIAFACPVKSCLNQGLSKNSNRKVSLHVSILPRLLKCLRCRGGSYLKHRKSTWSFRRSGAMTHGSGPALNVMPKTLRGQ